MVLRKFLNLNSALIVSILASTGGNYVALASKVQNPVRLRVDTKMLIDMFHRGDQSILDAFADIVTSMRGRRGYVNEPKANLLDSDDRCPEINYYQYSVVPIKEKTKR